MKTYIFAAFLGAIVAANGSVLRQGDWSAPVDGIRARLVVESPREIPGVDSPALYVELQNLTLSAFPRRIVILPYGQQFDWVLRDRQGAVVSRQGVTFGAVVTPPYALMLPSDSTLRMFISDVTVLPGVRSTRAPEPPIMDFTPKAKEPPGIDIYAGFHCWPARQNIPGPFYLAAIFKSAPDDYSWKERAGSLSWKGAISIPKIEIPITKEPIQSADPTARSGTPPAGAVDRAAASRGSS